MCQKITNTVEHKFAVNPENRDFSEKKERTVKKKSIKSIDITLRTKNLLILNCSVDDFHLALTAEERGEGFFSVLASAGGALGVLGVLGLSVSLGGC